MKLTENQIEEAVNDQLEKTLKYINVNAVQATLKSLTTPDYMPEMFNINDKEDILDFLEGMIREACYSAINFEETVASHHDWFHVVVYYDNEDSNFGPWICCNVIIGACSFTEEETRLQYFTKDGIIEEQKRQIEALKNEVEDLRISLHKAGGGGNYKPRTKTY